MQRSDPQSITTGQDLPEHDTSTERRRFLFYQDEGGMRATGDGNEDLGVIYYLVRCFFSTLLYTRSSEHR